MIAQELKIKKKIIDLNIKLNLNLLFFKNEF